MNNELQTFLVLLSVSVPLGLVLGLVWRMKFPESCKRHVKRSHNAQWKLFGFGVVLFSSFAVLSFMIGLVYFSWLSVGFACLELWCLITAGFKPLSKEMEKRIDESDPTKLSPFRFWK
jgi:hypothetical protein